MRLQKKCWLIAAAAALVAMQAAAQEMSASPDAMARITPEGETAAENPILSTKNPSAPPAALPWQAKPAPFGNSGGKPPTVTPPSGLNHSAPVAKPAANAFPGNVPFGRAEPTPTVPTGPHTSVSAPVAGVDSVAVSEPAPPTPVAPEADPVKEDPATPTEFSSPIFDASMDNGAPRKIILRVLNKVTAQAAQIEAKPGETVKFGQLEITAMMCRTSAPNSQRDDAGLLDVMERLPENGSLKPLFRGWMYASSPSVTALEHPVYDVAMVECAIASPPQKSAAKGDDKAAKKPKN